MSGAARTARVLGMLGLCVGMLSGCSWFSKGQSETQSITTPPPTAAAPATPGAAAEQPVAPAAPLRERGAQIADEAMLKALVQGQTTKTEVREIFGVPQEVVLTPGAETYLYIREKSSGWISRACERTEMLTVRFDPSGVLKEYEYRFAGK